MMPDKTSGGVRVRYNVSFFDWNWDEIVVKRIVDGTAHQMMIALEWFNRYQQHIAKEDEVVVPELPHPVAISIEVVYVQK